MSRIKILMCLLVLVATACGRTDDGKAVSTTTAATEMKPDKASPIVELCRGFDYADTAALHNEKVMAKRVASMVRLMPKSDTLEIDEALTVFLNGIKNDETALKWTAQYAYTYLENPASPVRDEAMYIRFLQVLLSLDSLPDAVRDRAEDRLRVAMLNRRGTIAADFRYLDRNGNKTTLHKLEAPYTLLVFYDPECPHCPEILNQVAKAPNINSAIADGNVKILAIYAEGKKDVWLRTRNDLPANWIVGYELSDILDNELYDLPAMPIIYLLDQDKRVMQKDADPVKICNLPYSDTTKMKQAL